MIVTMAAALTLSATLALALTLTLTLTLRTNAMLTLIPSGCGRKAAACASRRFESIGSHALASGLALC